MSGDIQISRFGRGIQKLFGLRQEHTLVNVLGDVFPVTNIDAPPAALQVFFGVDLCAGQASSTGAAGELGTVSLRANANTGKIVTCKGIWLTTNTGQAISLAIQALNGVAASATKSFLDTRRLAQGVPTSDITALSVAAAPGPAFLTIRIPTAVSMFVPLDVVLTQALNSATALNLTAMCSTAATQVTASFIWEERLAQPDELTPG